MGNYNKGTPNFWDRLFGKKDKGFVESIYNRDSEKRSYVETKVYNQKNIKPKQVKELNSIIVEDKIDEIPDIDDIEIDGSDIEIGTLADIEQDPDKTKRFNKNYGYKGIEREPVKQNDNYKSIADTSSLDTKDEKKITNSAYGGSSYKSVQKDIKSESKDDNIIEIEEDVEIGNEKKKDSDYGYGFGSTNYAKTKEQEKAKEEKSSGFFDWETSSAKTQTKKQNYNTKVVTGDKEEDLTKRLDDLLSTYNTNTNTNRSSLNKAEEKKENPTDINFVFIVLAGIVAFTSIGGAIGGFLFGVLRLVRGKQVEGIIIVIVSLFALFIKNT